MLQAVVLEHMLSEGAIHFDWMIEHPTEKKDRRLLTWRLALRPDLENAFEAEQIGAHRAAYLSYEGLLSGGRGSVRRLASGLASWERLGDDAVSVSICWSEAGIRRYAGRSERLGSWSFIASGD